MTNYEDDDEVEETYRRHVKRSDELDEEGAMRFRPPRSPEEIQALADFVNGCIGQLSELGDVIPGTEFTLSDGTVLVDRKRPRQMEAVYRKLWRYSDLLAWVLNSPGNEDDMEEKIRYMVDNVLPGATPLWDTVYEGPDGDAEEMERERLVAEQAWQEKNG